MTISVSVPSMVIDDPYVRDRVIEDRRAWEHDRYDEVWDGVYVLVPPPDNEQQDLVLGFSAVAAIVIKWPGLGNAFPGCNISDRDDDWESNYREPDFAAFLKGTRARNCGTHWVGGPDFGIEIRSPRDRTYEKLDFYAHVGTGELLIIDGYPWKLELYRRDGGEMRLVARSTLEAPLILTSEVIPLTFRLIPGDTRPRIEVIHTETGQRWEV